MLIILFPTKLPNVLLIKQWYSIFSATLNPKQTIIVTVRILTSTNMGSNYYDVVTLTAVGYVKVTKSAYIYVNVEKIFDYESPKISYHFTSDCVNVATISCETGSWSIEITAQDPETGILKIFFD